MPGLDARRFAAAAAVVALVTVGACGGGDEPDTSLPEVTDPTTTEPKPEAEIAERWDLYWQSRIASENAGKVDRDEFSKVARGNALESQARRVRNYQKNDLVRVGQPQFRDVEIRLNGSSATVLACLNADEWTAELNGEPFSAKKYGWEVTGNVMKQESGVWYVATEMSTSDVTDMGKTC